MVGRVLTLPRLAAVQPEMVSRLAGKHAKVDSADVNAYLRDIAEEDFTAKDFRTWHGTGHMALQLAALGPAETETETKRNIVQAVRETAKLLGNRPAACRKYYIHPAVLESYAQQTIFSVVPPVHHAARGIGLNTVEKAVIRLVKASVKTRK